jgi:GNAT superfamily N-acetyltransferase
VNAYTIRLATSSEVPQIWEVLQQAIARRKADGSNQWQDGYPNPVVVTNDIEKGVGYVALHNDTIVGYVAVLVNDEPEYANLKGVWITDTDFIVFHRVAVAEDYLGKGVAKALFAFIEAYAKQQGIASIKADTNFDNPAMLHLFHNLGYAYCGEVFFRGSPRKAFEKVLG